MSNSFSLFSLRRVLPPVRLPRLPPRRPVPVQLRGPLQRARKGQVRLRRERRVHGNLKRRKVLKLREIQAFIPPPSRATTAPPCSAAAAPAPPGRWAVSLRAREGIASTERKGKRASGHTLTCTRRCRETGSGSFPRTHKKCATFVSGKKSFVFC